MQLVIPCSSSIDPVVGRAPLAQTSERLVIAHEIVELSQRAEIAKRAERFVSTSALTGSAIPGLSSFVDHALTTAPSTRIDDEITTTATSATILRALTTASTEPVRVDDDERCDRASRERWRAARLARADTCDMRDVTHSTRYLIRADATRSAARDQHCRPVHRCKRVAASTADRADEHALSRTRVRTAIPCVALIRASRRLAAIASCSAAGSTRIDRSSDAPSWNR